MNKDYCGNWINIISINRKGKKKKEGFEILVWGTAGEKGEKRRRREKRER